MAWSCLGGGRIFSDQSAEMVRLRNTLNELAGEPAADSIDQVVYAWVFENAVTARSDPWEREYRPH